MHGHFQLKATGANRLVEKFLQRRGRGLAVEMSVFDQFWRHEIFFTANPRLGFATPSCPSLLWWTQAR